MDPKAKLTFLKVNHVGADGKYVDTGITHVTDLAPTLGGSTHTMPGYCSVAYTWETAVKRGPGHRGRIYPPNAAGLEVLHAFTMSDASATASATAGAALLTILKNASGANGTKGKPVVASKIGGQLVTITGVSVDNIFDIQSRRKNRIKATRSAIVAI